MTFNKTIAVHDNAFHADDVFAIAILKLVYPNAKIIRTRKEDLLKKTDIRVDVGRSYNPKKGDFDHHQPSGAGKRENGIPYAAAGLIWKHFGKKLASLNSWNKIDERIMQYIDANDNGIKTFLTKNTEPYTISNAISGLNPPWLDINAKKFYRNFIKAASIAEYILKTEIKREEEIIYARRILRDKIKKNYFNEYLVLNKYIPWEETLVNESKLKFIIYRESLNSKWLACAVPKKLNSFENRKDFPREWAGLADKELEKTTGVKGAIFCHNNLFIVAANAKEAVIKLVELALKN